MKLQKQFNQLTFRQYQYAIQHHRQYSNFNTLGLYRSILENKKLTLDEQLAVLDLANQFFQKTFEFLVLKDPHLYFDLTLLGKEVTKGDERHLWTVISRKQQQILKDKKLNHRNFGKYSKHCCGYDQCPLNGIMIRQKSRLAEMELWFHDDRPQWNLKEKSLRLRKQRKKKLTVYQAIDLYRDEEL